MEDHDDEGGLSLGAVFTVSHNQACRTCAEFDWRNRHVLQPQTLLCPPTHVDLAWLISPSGSLGLILSGDTICESPDGFSESSNIPFIRWNAAIAFASFLDSHNELVHDKFVLELGAGGGLPGIVAAQGGAAKVSDPRSSLVDD